MSRSEEVRQEVLRLDGHRCQITGARGDETSLQVHHWHLLGIGGSKALDTVENGITLFGSIHMDGTHPGVSVTTVRILHWDRNDKENGLVVERREGIADEWHPWPKSELWFYQKQRVERLEQAEARLIAGVLTDKTKAYDLWELATGDPPGYTMLDGYSEGETFSGYVSGRNISVRLANEAVTAYSWIKDKGLAWPQGLQLDKVDLIRRAEEQVEELVSGGRIVSSADGKAEMIELFDPQKWLDGAVDPSYQTVKQNLIDAGLKIAQAGWYFVFTRELLERKDIMPVYTRDLAKLLNKETGSSNVVIRVWGFKRGLHRDPATGGLKLFGVPLPFEDLTKEEYRLDTAEEAKRVAGAISEDLGKEAT